MPYWEDRLSDDQYNKVETAQKKFKKSRKTREAQDICYDELTNAGMYSEEADEMVNLLMQGD
jgi:hypothetical protein